MRAVAGALAFMAVVLELVACGSGGSAKALHARRVINPRDKARAEQILLRLGDFPSGWRAQEGAAAGGGPQCVNVSFSDLTITGEARSPEFANGSDTLAESDSAIFRTSSGAVSAFRRVASGSLVKCFADFLRHQSNSGVKVKSVSYGQESFPQLGERSATFQIAMELEANTTGVKLTPSAYADLVFIQRQRAVAILLFFDVLSPFDETLKEQLARDVGERTKVGAPATSTGQVVSVPFVEGITESLAAQKVAQAGLTPRIIRQSTSSVPAGFVFNQNPSGGDHATTGDVVVLTVSAGRQRTTVPDVRGDSLASAVSTLTQAGLRYRELDVDSTQAPGTVTGQSPAPGTTIAEGATVRINVSKGRPPIPVPTDLIGKTEADAAAELQQQGFNIGPTQQQDSEKPQGTVIDTNPRSGTVLQGGSAVTLIVSKGPQAAFVPDVRGFGVATAVATIRSAGFKAHLLYTKTDPTQHGVVVSQSPDPNTQAPIGAVVTLTVGK